MSSQAFIVAAKRTPFGAFGGKLKDLSANELGGLAAKAALAQLPASAQAHLTQSTSERQSVIFGNVAQTSTDAPYLARHVGLRAGLPITTPAYTVNRLCTSGFQTIINAVQEIKVGDVDVAVTGGSESMSQAPYVLRNVRWGTKFGPEYLKMEDALAASLTDRYPEVVPMAITAERLADQYSVSRTDCDEFALRSQTLWAQAQESGVYDAEIAPVEVKVKRAVEQVTKDEHPRPKTTIEGLAKLPAVFKKDGVVSAGNASGISDGGSACDRCWRAVRQAARHPAARPHRGLPHRRCRPGTHGHRPCRCHPGRPGQVEPDHGPDGHHRNQRGLCCPGPVVRQGSGHRSCSPQRVRWCHCPGPSARCLGIAHHGPPGAPPEGYRRPLRCWICLRRRWPGRGHHHRGPLSLLLEDI
ncbi:hypothetical protein DL89DRAFT_3361 [Linderina pennispora]|uniref:Thiolase N-terminal domain-containing protein n=1 Tax=Linderina pennispora TaxID=61395 RepID=A0A1Y1WJN8_9FUNG|nr:uncharacterized protein DL89DRAFT_3361 [Linderina pennispora]ORX73747.1 hypothetical protein DL89DRAFT_3361 [Linderina pennispora]